MSERAGADPGLTQVPGYLTHASGRDHHGLLWTWSELFSSSLNRTQTAAVKTQPAPEKYPTLF